jgi:hypothetical protein
MAQVADSAMPSWTMRRSVAFCQNRPGPKNRRSAGWTSASRMRAARGISPACCAAVRPRTWRPQENPDSLKTRQTSPEQS